MLEWMIYNAAIPLLPIPFVLLTAWVTNTHVRLVSLIADGQLCFYCTGIAAATISDIVAKMSQGQVSGNIGIHFAGLIICIILPTYAYGVAVTSKQAANWKLGAISIFTWMVTTIIVVSTRSAVGLFK